MALFLNLYDIAENKDALARKNTKGKSYGKISQTYGYSVTDTFGKIIVFAKGGIFVYLKREDDQKITHVKDIFGFEMITQNKFTTAQIDRNTWTEEMLDLLMDFIEKDDRAAEYRGLDWSEEYYLAINGDPNDTQSAL